MEIRLDEIAELTGGVLHGEGSQVCRGANPPGQCQADQVTLLVDVQKIDRSNGLTALAAIVPEYTPGLDLCQIVVSDPHAAFAAVVSKFRPPTTATLPGVGVDSSAAIANSAKIHPTATICSDVTIGARSIIMPGVVILAGSTIGEDCVIYPGTTLYEYTRLGDRVIIHAGSTIGAHGFGYRQVNGRHEKLAQLGYVEIHSDVEIGSGVTIDRGAYGATTIGEGTKIDNQVMIAHNCQIGKHNLICSQVGIAGSCTTGDYVILAGQVGLKDHVTLGDQAIVGAQAGVMDDLAPKQVYLGSPAIPQRDQMQVFALQRKLPEMRRELKALKRQLDALSRQQSDADASDCDQENRAA